MFPRKWKTRILIESLSIRIAVLLNIFIVLFSGTTLLTANICDKHKHIPSNKNHAFLTDNIVLARDDDFANGEI